MTMTTTTAAAAAVATTTTTNKQTENKTRAGVYETLCLQLLDPDTACP